MKVIRAEAMGFCFGVRDALEVAAKVANPADCMIHGELVHNATVLVQLEARGFAMSAESNRDSIPATPDVLITAHGISDRERRRLVYAGKRLIDTTCPLVTRVHRAARALEQEGRLVIVIGKPGHVEVRGIVEDLTSYEIVDCVEAVRTYASKQIGIVSQSTTPPRLADEIVAAVRQFNREANIQFIDTICQPTRDRQMAVERLLPIVDAVVVAGGRNSNNTRQLVSLCEAAGKRVFHVQTAADIEAMSLNDCRVIGLTAGTSTPDDVIQKIYVALCRLPEGKGPSNRRASDIATAVPNSLAPTV